MIRVLVADDHKAMRQVIKRLLERSGDIEVVGQAANGEEALALAREHNPDVIVTDAAMPVLNGLELLQKLTRLGQGVPVLMVSLFTDGTLIGQALHHGAKGFVTKTSITSHLEQGVRSVYSGVQYLCPVARQALED